MTKVEEESSWFYAVCTKCPKEILRSEGVFKCVDCNRIIPYPDKRLNYLYELFLSQAELLLIQFLYADSESAHCVVTAQDQLLSFFLMMKLVVFLTRLYST